MKNIFSEQQVQDLINVLDDALAKGPWEDSNFLKVIGKELLEIRKGLVNYLELSRKEHNNISTYVNNRAIHNIGEQEVFISLYTTEGRFIQSWERIVNNLPRQIISRPIYEKEEDVINAIKHKEHKENEAYVSVIIKSTDLLKLPEDKIPKDKLGKKLLVIKDKVISLDNIRRFVHISGNYQYFHGRLIKNKDL